MASSLKYPTTALTGAENPYDDNNWTSPENICADDATNTSITSSNFDSPDYSYLIYAGGFGFSIPSGATINGILVEVEKYNDAGELGVDAVVQFSKDGTNRIGDNKADTVNTWETTPTIKSYGGLEDLWGTTWTPDEINSANLELHFAAQANTANADIYVDFIRVTIYYTEEALPLPQIGFKYIYP